MRARRSGEPGALVEGLHVFTFNQVAETEAWRTGTCSSGCSSALGGPATEVGERALEPWSPVSTTVSGSPMLAAACSASARSSSSGSWASHTTRV